MKLNVGSGDPKGQYRTEEWVNIDLSADKVINPKRNVLTMSVLSMPEEWAGKFDEVHCIHVLEHIDRNLRLQVFEAIYKVMAEGGKLFLEVPDFEGIIYRLYTAYETGDLTEIHKWKTSIYGKQRYTGDSHHWGYDETHLTELAKQAKFQTCQTYTGTTPERMISAHYKQEPVILLEAIK